MEKLFIASNNSNKISEIQTILDENNINVELVCPKDFDDHDEPVEDGKTFEENAYIKAKYFHDKYHLPTIADDSGISIDYLDGKPGIHSARFLQPLDYVEKNDFILYLMRNTNNRKAQFIADICYIDENDNVTHYLGINEGEISRKQAGNEGFGYDPIFLIPEYNKTEAELGNAYKNTHSHRAKALRKWIEDVKQ
ncbi:MAG: RdgB/HAM1 family non-canonical purine NTP pyrophosphatase [Firmicutes bacterium]|nr:RdgB/HAM1 family non-canonical purine NTP pyrophosphatase [Candidatus Colivicinus equi]